MAVTDPARSMNTEGIPNSGVRFSFVAKTDLPRLAWCLHLQRGCDVARVTHGEWVETTGRSFFEGAWAGNLREEGFDETFMTGTGATLRREGLLLVTPGHTLDRLNLVRKGDELYVSNSLAYVLAMSREQLDPRFPFYDSCISSIKFGLNKYERTIVTKSGAKVNLFYACNVLVDTNLVLHVTPKKVSPPFVDYNDYRSYLDATAQRIVRNAGDPRRKARYVPLATVSRGYDSPAAMAIAKAAGCKEAFTFRNSRGTSADEDCGTTIGNHMDMAVREFDRLEYRNHADFPEILNSGGPNEFLSFGESLGGRLLFTGFHGDKIWDKNCEKVSTDLVRGDSSGASLTELRLRVGFLHLPVPFVGGDSHPSIHAISNSDEMGNWSLGNLYDRPIARRIVEEAGVPRVLFGQQKRAAGVYVPGESLRATMGESSFTDFQKFYDHHRNALASCKMHCMKLVKRLVYYNLLAAKLCAMARHRFGARFLRIPFLIPHRLAMLSYGYLGREAYLFHWGVEKLVSRYRSTASQQPVLRSASAEVDSTSVGTPLTNSSA